MKNIKNTSSLISLQFSKSRIINLGFTLVELIIVIVILAILATIAFLSFNSYSASARDSQRVSDARNITKGLGVAYTMAGKYPIPDSKININSGSVNIGYQGKAGESVLRRIQMSADGGIDPISGSYYTYSTNNKQSKYEVMGFLETQDNPILQDGGLELTRGKGYVFTMGDELGIITESTGGITYTFDSTTPSLAIEGSGDDKYVNINSGSVTDNPDIKIITSTTNTPSTGDDISDVVYIGYTSTGSINVSSLIERVTPLDIFASCTISGVTIKNNESRDFYSEENISYSASYDCSSKMETRKCINGTLNGDSSFSYISCVKGTPNNYAANPSYVYNGHTYSIPALTHLETYTSGIDSLPVSENNGSFKYTLTSITCNDGTVGSENETGPFLISCDSGFVDSGSNTCIVPISNPVAKASTSITSTSITWNWEVVSGATRYEFSTDNSTWSDKGNVLTFNETGLSPLTDYTRYVRACNSSNCSGGVSLGSVSTLATLSWNIAGGGDCEGVNNSLGVNGNTSFCIDNREYIFPINGGSHDKNYSLIKIEGKWWFNENIGYPIDTSKYKGAGIWSTSDIGLYSCPGNNGTTTPNCSSVITKGYLYQWSAIMNGSLSNNNTNSRTQGICPNGWAIPTKDDFTSVSNSYWPTLDNNWNGVTSGLNRTYPGYRETDSAGLFNSNGIIEAFWTSYEFTTPTSIRYQILYNIYPTKSHRLSNPKAFGYSLRCLKN